jgi:hypothetical protein
MTRLHAIAAGVCACTTACVQGSTKFETRDIIASMFVEVDETGDAAVRAELFVNVVQRLELAGDDAIYATLPDQEVELVMTDPGDYVGTLDGVGALDEVEFVLDRGEGDDSATDTRVYVPPPFDVAPLSSTSDSRTDPTQMAISWSPTLPASTMSIAIEGSCIVGWTYVVPDFGTHEFTPDSAPSTSGETCTVTATLSRSWGGLPDTDLDPLSSVRAEQIRRVAFTSTP